MDGLTERLEALERSVRELGGEKREAERRLRLWKRVSEPLRINHVSVGGANCGGDIYDRWMRREQRKADIQEDRANRLWMWDSLNRIA